MNEPILGVNLLADGKLTKEVSYIEKRTVDGKLSYTVSFRGSSQLHNWNDVVKGRQKPLSISQ